MNSEELLHYLDGLSAEEFVLHGSRHSVSILNPFQAGSQDNVLEWGEYGVYGTGVAELAILYAVIHESHHNWGWKFHAEEPFLEVVLPMVVMIGSGYVYLLPKKAFTKDLGFGVMQFSPEAVIPLACFEVKPDILEILENKRGVEFTRYQAD